MNIISVGAGPCACPDRLEQKVTVVLLNIGTSISYGDFHIKHALKRILVPRILKHPTLEHLVFRTVPPAAAAMIRSLHATCSFSAIGVRHLEEALHSDPPCVFTTWHFAFPAVIHFFQRLDGVLMVSRSKDGEWASRIVQALGYRTVRGSSHRGGSQALRAMLRFARRGHRVGFIADGSQGPRCVAQLGILWMARALNRPLLPLTMAAHPCWRLPTWDRTVIAKPFGHVVMAFGDLLHIPRQCSERDLEIYRLQLETQLNTLTKLAERYAKEKRGRRIPSVAFRMKRLAGPR